MGVLSLAALWLASKLGIPRALVLLVLVNDEKRRLQLAALVPALALAPGACAAQPDRAAPDRLWTSGFGGASLLRGTGSNTGGLAY